MLNSKFDINSPEWIDRVFENRNKSYGAYELRKSYGRNLFKAFAITIVSIAAIVGVCSYFFGEKVASVAIIKGKVEVTDTKAKIVPDGANPADAKPKSVPSKTGAATGKPTDAVDVAELDVKPSPFGGAAAWARFLETNLHYPQACLDLRLTGSVMMSFIVERDGSLSNIEIDQPAGHGFDEEAMRVLKLSPPWTTGINNGQRVRTKYTLPIDFRIERK